MQIILPRLGMSYSYRQAYGIQELSGKELGGCGDVGIHLNHLFR